MKKNLNFFQSGQDYEPFGSVQWPAVYKHKSRTLQKQKYIKCLTVCITKLASTFLHSLDFQNVYLLSYEENIFMVCLMGVRGFPKPPSLTHLFLQSIHVRSGDSHDCLCLPTSCSFHLHFPYCFCTRIPTLPLFFLHKPPWLYCNSFQKPFPQYHVHSWAGNC